MGRPNLPEPTGRLALDRCIFLPRARVERIFAAMLEIGALVLDQRVDHTAPEPGRCVERLRSIAPALLAPGRASCRVHLSPMGRSNDGREIARELDGFLRRQSLDIGLHVLWTELPDEKGAVEKARRAHALAEVRRKLTRSFKDALPVVSRYLGLSAA